MAWPLFSSSGRQEEAAAEVKRALEIDPLSLIINSSAGRIFYLARQYDQAMEQLRKTLDMDPNFARAHFFLGQVYQQKGMFEEDIAEFKKAHQLDVNQYILAGLGNAFAVSGRRGEAKKILDELRESSRQRYASPYGIAVVYAGLGEKDQAFAWLEKAYKDRDETLTGLKVDPKLDSLRSDPRFQHLLRRAGPPQ